MLNPDPFFYYPSEKRVGDILTFLDGMQGRRESYTVRYIEAGPAYMYRGDFYGLLLHLGVEVSKFLPTLYLNNLTHPCDYAGEAGNLKIALDIVVPR